MTVFGSRRLGRYNRELTKGLTRPSLLTRSQSEEELLTGLGWSGHCTSHGAPCYNQQHVSQNLHSRAVAKFAKQEGKIPEGSAHDVAADRAGSLEVGASSLSAGRRNIRVDLHLDGCWGLV
jgi:hypothetical protein